MRARALIVFLGSSLLSVPVSADKVHLVSGTVIEGKARRQGDKVIVEVESGEVTLPADAVQRIESGTSDVQQFEAMYAKVKPQDVQGLMKLADYCRDHEMPAREKQVLQKVIEAAPDNAEARSRLGYVRSDSGWIKREEQMRAQGMIEYEGKWMTREQMLELERLRAQTDTAIEQRDKARAEARKAELEAQQAEQTRAAQQQRAEQPAQQTEPMYYSPYTYGYGYSYSPYAYAPRAAARACAGRAGCVSAAPPAYRPGPAPGTAPFPIPGVKDPFSYFR